MPHSKQLQIDPDKKGIISMNESHSNIIVNRLQGYGHSKKLPGKWKWVTQQ